MFDSDVENYDSDNESTYSTTGGNEEEEEVNLNEEEVDESVPKFEGQEEEEEEEDEEQEEGVEFQPEEVQSKNVKMKSTNVVYPSSDEDSNDSDEDSSDDSDDEDYDEVQNKIDNDYKVKFIQQNHPEEVHNNYQEINFMCNVERDENGMVIDDRHTTYPILSKYEKTRLLGLRLTQLNKGAKPFIKYNKQIVDNTIIALDELNQKLLPFIIMRPLPNGKKEYWRLADLEII